MILLGLNYIQAQQNIHLIPIKINNEENNTFFR